MDVRAIKWMLEVHKLVWFDDCFLFGYASNFSSHIKVGYKATIKNKVIWSLLFVNGPPCFHKTLYPILGARFGQFSTLTQTSFLPTVTSSSDYSIFLSTPSIIQIPISLTFRHMDLISLKEGMST